MVQAVNNLFKRKRKSDWYSRYKLFTPKLTVCATFVKMWKCIFRSFDLFQFPFWQQKKPLLDVLCRVHRAFSLSASDPKRKLIKFSQHYKYKSSISWFLHILLSYRRYHVGWIEELFILFKICIAITILEFIPKTKTFQELSTIEALCITSTTLHAIAIFFVQIAIDFSQPFIFRL